jgi:AmiR/NasT family two-component response regulator
MMFSYNYRFSQSDPSSPQAGGSPVTSSGPSAILTGKRVVIVEDEGITQMQLRRVLTRAGMQVVGFALTGAEGIDVILREKPDIVLMDITMPGPINGLEALRQVLTQFLTCVVMVTAYSEYKDQAAAAGAVGYVVKPIDSISLIPQLEQAYLRWQGKV